MAIDLAFSEAYETVLESLVTSRISDPVDMIAL